MSDAPAPPSNPSRLENSIPILRVVSLERSVAFYTNALGFSVDWSVEGMASVSRDRASVMLCEGAQGNPGTWVWMGADDVADLDREFRARGTAIALPPTNYQWAREIHVVDPDGHVIRFGSEPLETEPVVDWIAWYSRTAPAQG